MPERGRDLNRAITVVNRFTTKADPEKFEREFLEHSEFLREQVGFDFCVTVRLADRPETYVHLAYWRNLEAFVRITHDEVFLAHVQRLGQMVVTEADQMVVVQRRIVDDSGAGPGEGRIFLTEYEADQPEEFERRFQRQASGICAGPAIGGVDLLRSTLTPWRYLGVAWWYDAQEANRAVSGEEYLNHAERLRKLSTFTTHATDPVAYMDHSGGGTVR